MQECRDDYQSPVQYLPGSRNDYGEKEELAVRAANSRPYMFCWKFFVKTVAFYEIT